MLRRAFRIQRCEFRFAFVAGLFAAAIKYGDKVFRFLLNGQTGKTYGDKPLSQIRIGIAVAIGVAAGAGHLVVVRTSLILSLWGATLFSDSADEMHGLRRDARRRGPAAPTAAPNSPIAAPCRVGQPADKEWPPLIMTYNFTAAVRGLDEL